MADWCGLRAAIPGGDMTKTPEWDGFIEDKDAVLPRTPEIVAQLGSTASGRHHLKWEARLRSGFNAGRESPRNVRLPSPEERRDGEGKLVPLMRVSGEGDEAHIDLNCAAVTANMQTNAAAFEGWSLALRQWAGASRVKLSWDAPSRDANGNMVRHHERLVYRASRFAELFPTWFSVEGDLEGSRALDTNPQRRRLLNTPGKRGGLRAASMAAMVNLRKWSNERQMECSLRHHGTLATHFGFGDSQRDQQFPVGLFDPQDGSAVARDADSIFPGRKGAIDLVCADGDRFWLFELKARKNIPLGALSELIFYASVLRDVRRGHFGFADGAWDDCDVKAEDLEKAQEIIAVLLGDHLHPLLDDPSIWQELNRAATANWNSQGSPHVEFRAAKTGGEGFEDVTPWR